MSELSELDEDTISIENSVRKLMPNLAKKSKTTSTKKSSISKPKPRRKTMETELQSDTETSTVDESDKEDETEIQAPKRKRPSDYIAKKDRPENLKSDKKINKLSLDEAIAICKLSAKRAKLENSSVDSDDAPEKKTFKKLTDDGVSKLHPARFERQPLGPPSKWWSEVPVKRSTIIKNIPLRHLGKQRNTF